MVGGPCRRSGEREIWIQRVREEATWCGGGGVGWGLSSVSTKVKVAGEEGTTQFDFGKASNPLAKSPVSMYVYIGVVSQGERIKGQEFEVQRDPHGHLVPKNNCRECYGLVSIYQGYPPFDIGTQHRHL